MESKNILIFFCFVFLASSCAHYDPCSYRKEYFLYGYEIEETKTSIEPKFTYAGDFIDGLALVCESKNKQDDTCAFMDKTGRYVLSGFALRDGGAFSEGMASFKKDGKFGYIDRKLNFVIAPQFEFASPFYGGLAAVRLNRKWGYIEKTGRLIIPPQFDWAYRFSEGLAAVQVGGKYGYVDKTGKFIISPQFFRAESFSEGLAGVQISQDWDRGWVFIDKTGRVAISRQFKEVQAFRYGRAPVNIVDRVKDHFGKETVQPRGWGLIDKTGKIVLEPQYTYIYDDGSVVRVTYPGGGEAIIDRQGKVLKKVDAGYTITFDPVLSKEYTITSQEYRCVSR